MGFELRSLFEIINNHDNVEEKVVLQKIKTWEKQHPRCSLHADPALAPITIRTPLMAAAMHNYLSIVRYFIDEKNISPNERNAHHHSALEEAITQRHVEVALYLTEKATCFPPDSIGYTALHMACAGNLPTVVQAIIEKAGPSIIHLPSNLLATALHLAAQDGFYETVCCLLKYGALGNVYDIQGSTPLELAMLRGHTDIVERMLQDPQVCPIIHNPLSQTTISLNVFLEVDEKIIPAAKKTQILDKLLMAGAGLLFPKLPKKLHEHYGWIISREDQFVLLGEYTNFFGKKCLLKITTIEALKQFINAPSWYFHREAILRACQHPTIQNRTEIQQIAALFGMNESVKYCSMPESFYALQEPFPPSFIDKPLLNKLSEYDFKHHLGYQNIKIQEAGSFFSLFIKNYTTQTCNITSLGLTYCELTAKHYLSEICRLLHFFHHNDLSFIPILSNQHAWPMLLSLTKNIQLLSPFFTEKKDPVITLRICHPFEKAFKLIETSMKKILTDRDPKLYNLLAEHRINIITFLVRAYATQEDFHCTIHYASLALTLIDKNAVWRKGEALPASVKSNQILLHFLPAHVYFKRGWLTESYPHLIECLKKNHDPELFFNFLWPMAMAITRALANKKLFEKTRDLYDLTESVFSRFETSPMMQKVIAVFTKDKESFYKIYYIEKIYMLLNNDLSKIVPCDLFSPNEAGNIILTFHSSLFHQNNMNIFLSLIKKYPALLFNKDTLQLAIPTAFFISEHFTSFMMTFKKTLTIPPPHHSSPASHLPLAEPLILTEKALEQLSLEPKKDKPKTRGKADPSRANKPIEQSLQVTPDAMKKISEFFEQADCYPPLPMRRSFNDEKTLQCPDRYFVSVVKDKDFKPFYDKLFKNRQYVQRIASGGTGKAGMKMVAQTAHNEQGHAYKEFIVRAKIIGAQGGKLRARGSIKKEIPTEDGICSLFLIDTLDDKNGEKRYKGKF